MVWRIAIFTAQDAYSYMPQPASKTRPLSPHLQVYRPQITSVLSIIHRATGVALSFGLIVLVLWLSSLAGGADAYTMFVSHATEWYGRLILGGLSFCAFYHWCNGIRHLFWDMGKGFDLKNVTRSGLAALFMATAMTAGLWYTVIELVGTAL